MLFRSIISVVVELGGKEHADRLYQALTEAGYVILEDNIHK